MNYLIFPKPKKNYPDNSYGVTDISKDKEGKVWIATYAALFNYDGKTMTNYTIDKKLKSQMIWVIYKDNNNNLLFGMANGGVYKFNGKLFEKQF